MKSPIRKVLAVFGGIAVGVLSAVAVATPAQAHHTTVTATTECADNGWVVNWTVENWGTNLSATIDRLESSAEGPITGDLGQAGASLPADQPYGKLTGQQIVPLAETSVTLKVTATWSNNVTETNSSGPITINADDCAKPPAEPTAAATQNCQGIVVTVSNPQDGQQSEVVLTPSVGDAKTVNLAPGATEAVEFIAPTDATDFSVTLSGALSGSYAWEQPTGCAPVTLDVAYDCDGITFTMVNPDDGSEGEVVFTPTSGDAKTFTLKPGATVEVPFEAEGDKFAVTVAGGDYEETFEWVKPSEGCEAAPSLPQTGSSTTMWVASGVGALVVGAGLIFLVRRRKAAATW